MGEPHDYFLVTDNGGAFGPCGPRLRDVLRKVLLGCLVLALASASSWHVPPHPGKASSSLSDASNALPPSSSPVVRIQVASSQELVDRLKALDLWEIATWEQIPVVAFERYPDDISKLRDVREKKRVFFHTLLPAALVALDEVEGERAALQEILKKLGALAEPESFFLSAYGSWENRLSGDERAYIQALTEKYRTNQASELLQRVNTVPLSLLMAQGALESSWGGSRLAREGNNLFGVLTWDDEGEGIQPEGRNTGQPYRYAAYNSILDSVRAYVLLLNRLPAYERMREIRTRTMNSVRLANGLRRYSERGEAYVDDLKSFIVANQLNNYDRLLRNRQTERLESSARPI